MPTTSVPWMGNRVVMWEIEDTELTALEWRRPYNGVTRGFRVLGAEELAWADHRVAVPIYGRAESLNVGTAATVCLYASARAQRRRAAR